MLILRGGGTQSSGGNAATYYSIWIVSFTGTLGYGGNAASDGGEEEVVEVIMAEVVHQI